MHLYPLLARSTTLRDKYTLFHWAPQAPTRDISVIYFAKTGWFDDFRDFTFKVDLLLKGVDLLAGLFPERTLSGYLFSEEEHRIWLIMQYFLDRAKNATKISPKAKFTWEAVLRPNRIWKADPPRGQNKVEISEKVPFDWRKASLSTIMQDISSNCFLVEFREEFREFLIDTQNFIAW